jgi:DNA-binding CsgD family transcriptional regulator
MSRDPRPQPARESPQAALGRLIQQESARLETRRRELEDAQTVIAGLAAAHDRPALASEHGAALEVIPGPRVVAVFQQAIGSTVGLIRHFIKSTGTIPARDEPLVRWAQAQVAQGRELRTIYPSSFLLEDNVPGRSWVHEWADVGEQQRVLEEVPHAFTVFGDELVLACTEWGVVTDDLVAVRSPLLVRAFSALFDDAWRLGLPVPQTTYDDVAADRLLTMLASGLKDEAIARYLGVSLRTVRRRVAALMEELGAQTRFQLGSAAERRGLLGAEPD